MRRTARSADGVQSCRDRREMSWTPAIRISLVTRLTLSRTARRGPILHAPTASRRHHATACGRDDGRRQLGVGEHLRRRVRLTVAPRVERRGRRAVAGTTTLVGTLDPDRGGGLLRFDERAVAHRGFTFSVGKKTAVERADRGPSRGPGCPRRSRTSSARPSVVKRSRAALIDVGPGHAVPEARVADTELAAQRATGTVRSRASSTARRRSSGW